MAAMSPANRTLFTKIHLILAALMFPAMLMFLVTGALYTWGETGDYVDTEHQITLTAPLTNDEDSLTAIAASELARLDIAPPSGSASVRTLGDAYRFEWSGSNRDVHLVPTADPLVATLTVKETTLHRRLVQLHKAKGATAFKIYATILAISLFLLVLSGIVMGLATPALRRMTWWVSGLGSALFAGAVALG
jgi:hypothetical protein